MNLVLGKAERFSSVSGGSITVGLLAKEWDRLDFRNGVSAVFATRIVEPLRQFCRLRIDTLAIGEGLLTPWKTVSNAV